MFRLGGLVVLCGLLIGTSESLLQEVGNAVNNLNVLNPSSGDVSQSLNLNVESLQQATSWSSAKDNLLETLNTANLGNSKSFLSFGGLQLRINNLRVLDIQAGLSSSGKGVDLKLPLALDASVILPGIGSAVDVAVSLDLINSVTVQTNAQTGLPEITIGKCSSNSDKISISLLGRRLAIINTVLDAVSGLLKNAVSVLLQNIVCPVLQYALSHLNGNVIQGLLSNISAAQLPISL
ncbi:BPI fold-containing family A member 2 [Apodemus sylvaticus]|uniref:BPI fold-containing family A member 2 n=1 Tax=Apodemus sylvaticus TaxID=10129 RepID=UPI002244E17E|nr:BPI fold-containing family A member 2 [Apodemus sylvaticus]